MEEERRRALRRAKEEAEFEEIRSISLSEELVLDATYTALGHPLWVAQTLVELGHEPFPLRYFAPNLLVYVRKLVDTRGHAALFWALDAHLAAAIVANLVEKTVLEPIGHFLGTNRHLERHVCEEAAGRTIPKRRQLLATFNSLVRLSIARTLSLAAAYPLTVAGVRLLAQQIDERPPVYANVLDAIRAIGAAEGAAGLWSGFQPALMSSLVGLWLSSGLAIGIALTWPLVQQFRNCSRLMSVSGSPLHSTVLPLAPQFAHWTDALRFLRMQRGERRGWLPFWRVHRGHIRAGSGQQFFADYRNFLW
ncbi:hypothetical protein M3Y99_01814400 [Aphelenchoides fujianensis]|nr:hypothetical protein M3Y99_01814400 [Aphelenchoides fujianensis]